MNSTKEQCFVHLATYRLADLRRAGLVPDGSVITPAIAGTLSTRLADVCARYGWNLIDMDVLPDRVEALLTGTEPDGEKGEAVAMVLDGAVYGGVSPRAAAMN